MYIILPSNTGDFSTNKTNSFRVKLPQSLSLNGDWEVALTEVQYPISWNTIKMDEGRIYLDYHHGRIKVPIEIRIQAGYYHNIEELSEAIDEAIETAGTQLPDKLYRADVAVFRLARLKMMNTQAFMEWGTKGHSYADIFENPDLVPQMTGEVSEAFQRKFGENVSASDQLRQNPPKENMLSSALKIKYVHGINRVQMEWLSETIKGITLNKSLQFILGFTKESKFHKGITKADYNVDITGAETSFFIYCNIVQPQFVGNSLKQLLRTIPVSTGTLGQTINKEFISLNYVGVLTNEFDTIEVEIRNDFGTLIDFQFGKIIIKLHLRRKSLLHL